MFIISEQEEKCSVASFPPKLWTLQGEARARRNQEDQQPRGLFSGRLEDISSPPKCSVTAPLTIHANIINIFNRKGGRNGLSRPVNGGLRC